MVRQLTPLVRFDGYHVLADVTGVPDLFHRIKPTLLGAAAVALAATRGDRCSSRGRAPSSRRGCWSSCRCWRSPCCMMVLALPRVLGTAWASLRQAGDLLGAAWGDGDLVEVAARLLAIVAVVLPIARHRATS